MLSKQQSYLLTVCFTLLTIGCANYTPAENRSVYAVPLSENLLALSLLNLLLCLCLIAAVTPHRQTLQDWVSARHKKGSNSKRFPDSSLVKDLIWGEKSPAVVAIALNVAIVIIPLALFILLSPAQSATGTNAFLKINESRTGAFFGLTLKASLMLIYASIAQLLLFMRTQQRTFWTTGTLGALILLPQSFLRTENCTLSIPWRWCRCLLLSLRSLTRLGKRFSANSGSGTDTCIAEPATDTPLRQAGEQIKESSHVTSQ
jgi:hypothetical protein